MKIIFHVASNTKLIEIAQGPLEKYERKIATRIKIDFLV